MSRTRLRHDSDAIPLSAPGQYLLPLWLCHTLNRTRLQKPTPRSNPVTPDSPDPSSPAAGLCVVGRGGLPPPKGSD